MAESTESKTIDWSPWKHPKAKRWFEELLEETHLPLMMEHAVDKARSVEAVYGSGKQHGALCFLARSR